MAVSSKSDVAVKLAALQMKFKQRLSGTMAEIERLWETLCQNDASNTNLVELHRLIHNLAGSGGTFGAMTISTVARELVQPLKSLLKESG